MGNENGKPAGKLGVSALATISLIEKNHVDALKEAFLEASRKGTMDHISRDDLKEALEKLDLKEPDTEILDRMFTMFDDMGENNVMYNNFCAAICLLTTGAPRTKLKHAFSLYDRKGSGSINRLDTKNCLCAMNSACSYFGDPVVGDDEIAEMLNECYKKGSEEGIVQMSAVKYEEFIPLVIDSQLFFKFICALGTVNYVKSK